jgi:hypothetical protein
MKSNTQREPAPVHLYIPGRKSTKQRGWGRRKLRDAGIDALWMDADEKILSGANESESMPDLPVIYHAASQSAIERISTLSPAGIAIDPRSVELVIDRASPAGIKHTPLYLLSRTLASVEVKKELETIALSVDRLRAGGFREIFCVVPVSHSTALYNGYAFLKRDLGVKTFVVLSTCGDEADPLVRGALHIGSLFYKGFTDGVLLKPQDSAPLERREIMRLLAIAKGTLSTLGRYPAAYTIVSCPMCGRCEIDIPGMTEEVDHVMRSIEKEYAKRGMPLAEKGGVTVAVMGCNVNGPGEARGADIGIAGGRGGSGTIFIKGKVHATLPEGELLEQFSELVRGLIDERKDLG